MRTTTLYLTLATLVVMTNFAQAQVQELVAWWMDEGQTDSTGLGTSVAALGDVNGDGYDDFIVGTDNDEAFLYYGSSSPDTVPDLVFHKPDTTCMNFGDYVLNIGDVNGDGCEDFVIHAYRYNALEQCRAYLYFGGVMLDAFPDLVIDGEINGLSVSYFAKGGAGIGDFNGDGGNDFLLMDQGFWIDYSQGMQGRVYVYYGGNALDSLPDWQISGGEALQKVGVDIAGLGDVNDDGYDDFVIVRWDSDGPFYEERLGYFAVFYGGSAPDTLADVLVWGPENNACLGLEVDAIDFNRDGVKDVIVGSSQDFPPNHITCVQIALSPLNSSGQPAYIFLDPSPINHTIGKCLVGIDLNGDGWQDFITGDPLNVLWAGSLFAYLGGENPDTLHDAVYFQGNVLARLGSSVCNVGDINGDDIEDLVIGEPNYDQFYEGTTQGRIHVILGDTTYHQSVGVAPEMRIENQRNNNISMTVSPNPLNRQAIIRYSVNLPASTELEVAIFNLGG